MIEVLPDHLIDPLMATETIQFIKALAVPPRLKKETLIAWTKAVEIQLTREMVIQLLGDDLDRVL